MASVRNILDRPKYNVTIIREATTFWPKDRYFKCVKQNPSRNANHITSCDMDQCSFLRTISLNGEKEMISLDL
jgi:hypothetical protein